MSLRKVERKDEEEEEDEEEDEMKKKRWAEKFYRREKAVYR